MTNAEIQVGEYVRTTSGFIAKCIEKDEYNLEFDDYVRVSYGEEWSNLYPNENDVLNHSFNLIDLIEVGDYVNGERVVEIGKTRLGHYKYIVDSLDRQIFEENISTIVTKEQFKSMEYVRGGEDD